MADAKFDIKTEATRPFYATVGATDLAVSAARAYLTEVQSKVADVQKKIESFEFEPKNLNAKAQTVVTSRVDSVTSTVTKEAKERQAKLEARLAELQAEAKKAQARFEAQVAELQGDAKALPAKAQAFVADTLAEVAETYAFMLTETA